MDPITQFALGGAAAQVVSGKRMRRSTFFVGGLAGMFPDADVFLKTSHDLLGHGDLHRHFTHSLLFIPFGGLLIAGIMMLLLPRLRKDKKAVIQASLVGIATHALLDCCTSYGTHLFWPFSNERLAWDFISIVDPLYSLPLIIASLWAVWRVQWKPALWGLFFAHMYLLVGIVQHHRAMEAQMTIAESRVHTPTRGRVFPSLGNLVYWRSVYEVDGVFYTDSIKTPFLGRILYEEGTSLPRFELPDIPPAKAELDRVVADFNLFSSFADDYVVRLAKIEGVIVLGDLRYGNSLGGDDTLWGLMFQPESENRPFQWVEFGEREKPQEYFKKYYRFSGVPLP